MRRSAGAHYPKVEGLARGLAVLRALNAAGGGIATPNELAAGTGLHRTTARRLLETLVADGFVRKSESDESYRLTLKVRELSEGFTDDEWISQVAAPVLGELLEKTVWPSDLTTLDGDSMIIRETTHRFSPLSFHRSMVRRRMPLLFTASGKAYLAYCPEDERRHLLELLRAGNDEQASFARREAVVARMLERVRQLGYATNEGDWKQEAKIAAIALPVTNNANVLACLNVVFLKRAMSTEEAARRFLPAMRAAVARIEHGRRIQG